MFVSNPKGSWLNSRNITKKETVYIAIYILTLFIVSFSICLPSNSTLLTERGCSIWRISFLISFSKITIRETFNPPDVEPAHPPINIRQNKMPFESSGQRLKSAVEYPVVVIIEET